MPELKDLNIASLEQQIQKLKGLKERWASGRGLTEEELLKRDITLELLDGAIGDLLAKMRALKKGPQKIT